MSDRKTWSAAAVFAAVLLLLAACGSEEAEKQAGPQAEPPPVKDWDDVTVNTLCLEVTADTPRQEVDEGAEVSETITRILKRAGFQIVDAGQTCDATLLMKLVSESITVRYMGLGECHMNASAETRTSLSSEGQPALHFTTRAEKMDEPRAIQEFQCAKTADKNKKLDAVEIIAIVKGLNKVWGPDVAAQGLGADVAGDGIYVGSRFFDVYVMNATLEALKEIGWEAVPVLIGILEEPKGWGSTSAEVTRALQEITSQDIGSDARAWRKWWESRE